MQSKQIHLKGARDYPAFKRNCKKTLETHFLQTWESRSRFNPDLEILFPTHILFSETQNHFCFELIGLSKMYRGLTVKQRRVDSIESLLCNFVPEANAKNFISLETNSKAVMRGLVFTWGGAYEVCQERFPGLDTSGRAILTSQSKDEGIVRLSGDGSFFMRDCITMSKVGNSVRCRTINCLAVFSKGIGKRELLENWEVLFMEEGGFSTLGLSVQKGRESDFILANQFRGLFLRSGVSETTITDYLEKHPKILKKAFDCDNIQYQLKMPWIEHDGSIEETAIIPDAMIRRVGSEYYDIVDFKLPLLFKKRLVTGKGRKRGFLKYLEEGIAQVANYRFYFEFQKNREFAEKEYGIKVKNPKMTLVVGHMENAFVDEIKVALRKYLDGAFDIVDYDSLCAMYLSSREAA